MRRALSSLSVTAVTALAVTGVVAPSVSASAAACGQPAVPAVYETIHHPAVHTPIAAVTHPEWEWTRTVEDVEVEFRRVVAPAVGHWEWSREERTTEREYRVRVIDEPAVPAVPEQGHYEPVEVAPAVVEVQHEFIQQTTGNLRWREPGWNAGQLGNGWSWTGETRELLITPAVMGQVWVVDVPAVPARPEVAHDELQWVADGAAAPAGGVATGATRELSALEVENHPEGSGPIGGGWIRGDFVETAPALTDEFWVAEGAPAPADAVATGGRRVIPLAQAWAGTSATAPAGDGWVQVPGSMVEVVDVAARIEITPAWVEDFLISPAVPATAPCEPVSPDTGSVDAELEDRGVAAVVEIAGVRSDARVAAAAALPATGAGVEPWWLLVGGGAVILGARLVRRSRT